MSAVVKANVGEAIQSQPYNQPNQLLATVSEPNVFGLSAAAHIEFLFLITSFLFLMQRA